MRHSRIRGPSWCTFGVGVAIVVLICVLSIKITDTGWSLGNLEVSKPALLPSNVLLNSWERNTVDEYALKLTNATSRSQPPCIRYYEFVIASRITYINGIHREILVINGQYPGPLIEVVEGDTVIVNVLNRIENADPESQRITSIHFHGQLMNRTNFYDGSIGLNHCGIPPGKNFTYEFVTDSPGTYWYHSHWDLQQIEGLVGPMIIHARRNLEFSASKCKSGCNKNEYDSHLEQDENGSYLEEYQDEAHGIKPLGPLDERKDKNKGKGKGQVAAKRKKNEGENDNKLEGDETKEEKHYNDVSEEAVVLLSDLYNRPARDLLLDYTEPWIGGTEEPIPDIALAQGKTEPVITLSKGGKVRLRIINAGSYTAFNIRLEGHQMRVVEADSTNVEPTDVRSLLIYPAQRYSVIVDLKDSYAWLHATPQLSIYGRDPHVSHSLSQSSGALKTLIVHGNFTVEESIMTENMQLNKVQLTEPYFWPSEKNVNMKQPQAELESFIDITMTRSSSGEIAGALNNQVYQPMKSGNLLKNILEQSLQTWQRNESYQDVNSHNQILFEFDDIQIVDLVIRNFDDDPHPVHLHGYQVWVVSRGYIDSVKYTWKSPRPLKRDTVWLPENQWVRLRLIVDNPGVWAIHCHIPWHSNIGMKGAILALPSSLAKQKPPQDWYKLCRGS